VAWVGYGGTFDPVHLGHVAIARAVRDALGAPVALLPAADPPHKDRTHADARHRRRMLELALAGERGLAVDARELDREGPSYTVDTLGAIRHERGGAQPLVWVVGADSLGQLPRWHRWPELFELAHVLAVERPGHSLDTDVDDPVAARFLASRLGPVGDLRTAPAGTLALLRVEPLREESSSEVRDAIRAGRPWRGLVAPAVAAYIDRHRLYAGAAAA
jgi:nicotinate-nucleotide adenylyltransferase